MVNRGEVRWASAWPFRGSEPSGDRPVLIITPTWFNQTHNPIVVPLTTQSPRLPYPWQPHLNCTDSWALIPSVKTVPVSLSSAVKALASPEELDYIGFQLSRLVSPDEASSGLECNTGEVWNVDLSSPPNPPHLVNILVLRYDDRNGMAMTLHIVNRQDGTPEIEIPIGSYAPMAGQSVSIGRIWPLYFPKRFKSRVGRLSQTETELVTTKFLRLTAPNQQPPNQHKL